MNKTKPTRLTLNDLSRIVENTTKRIMNESVGQDRNIQYAYEMLDEIKQDLNAIGIRLYKTPFSNEYRKIYTAIERLKSNLLHALYLKGGKK